MDISKVAFEAANGLPVIYSVGFIPRKSSFVELTPQQYSIYYSQGGDISCKVFAISPERNNKQSDIVIVRESQIPSILSAGALIKGVAKSTGLLFRKESEMLDYVMHIMPEIQDIVMPWIQKQTKKSAG